MKLNKKWILLIAAASALLVIFLCIFTLPDLLSTLNSSYTVNKVDQDTKRKVADPFRLYSGEDLGYSFLYPENRQTGFSKTDGSYIYCGDSKEAPYVLICRNDKPHMNPEKYFKSCNKLMLKCFSQVASTPINEVKVEGKTLYLVRYECDNLIIDRYLELYKDFYIQYTAISSEKGSLNTELYYAIATLRINEGAYLGAYSEKVTNCQHEDLKLSMDLPEMLERKDLTIGYFASSEDIILLALRITEDDNKTAIYNRKDFIDRAAKSPNFVAGLLGADTATFTEGKKKTFGGKSFYCYPMEMESNKEPFSGELCLANADETGCWLLCYAIKKDYAAFEKTQALLEKCIDSVRVE